MNPLASATNRDTPLILVVDDDRSTRTLLTLAMEEEGYRVEAAKDGEQCLAEYERCQPDMVLLDAVMPTMDGFTCCQHLRDLPTIGETPILMITVLDDPESVEQAFNAGATDYITKPIQLPVLSQKVRRLLDVSQSLIQARQTLQWETFFRQKFQEICQRYDLKLWLNTIVTEARNLFRLERVLVCSPDQRPRFEAVQLGYPAALESAIADPSLQTDYKSEYQQGQTTPIEDTSNANLSAQAIATLQTLQVSAALMIPLSYQQRFLGVLCLHHCKATHRWQTLEIERAVHLGSLVAIAIQNAQKASAPTV